jgi:hypothetical protein
MLKLRAAALCGAGLCAAAAWEAARLEGGPQRTLLTLLAFGALIALAIALVALALSPALVWTRMVSRVDRMRDTLAALPLLDERRIGIALIILSFATYVLLAIIYVPRQIPPNDNDQEAYLALANEIRERGGFVGCLRDQFTGQFTEANRHPLYPMLLSYFPTYELGKWLSAVLGGVTLLTLTVAVSRKFNETVAGLFAVSLATNAAFMFVSTLVACEVLVVWSAGIVWLMCVPTRNGAGNIDRTANADATEPPIVPSNVPTSAFAALVGALFGTMYLIKGHAVLLVAGLILWLPIRFRTQLAQAKNWIAVGIPFLIGFVVVASPLLARNIVRYGQPFFNVNGHLLFEDQYVDPVALAEQKSVRQAAADYVRSHTIGQMLRREFKGLAWEAYIMVRSLGPAPWDDGRVIFGGVMVIACLIGMSVEPRGKKKKADLIVPWALVLWLFFAWYVPIAAGERFILPLLVPALVYTAIGMLRLVRMVKANAAPPTIASWLLAACIVWCAATVASTYRFLALSA